jgi:hypothetical protein
MEANQVRLVAAAVFCDAQQVVDALESRFTSENVRDFLEWNRGYRFDDDMALVHSVTAADLHVWTCPDANAASDSPAPDSFAKAFGE